MAKLRRLHRAAALLAAETPEVIRHSEASHSLEQALVEAMVACISAENIREDKSAQRRHAAIIRRFHSMLEADPNRPLYVLEIAKAIGVSVRCLSNICQEHLGMGPKQYLLLRRMNLARQALTIADPHETTVTEVATRYGFWQFGRFSGEYKRLFGELPSVTLRTDVRSGSFVGNRPCRTFPSETAPSGGLVATAATAHCQNLPILPSSC